MKGKTQEGSCFSFNNKGAWQEPLLRVVFKLCKKIKFVMLVKIWY